jgi:hypothetical protein
MPSNEEPAITSQTEIYKEKLALANPTAVATAKLYIAHPEAKSKSDRKPYVKRLGPNCFHSSMNGFTKPVAFSKSIKSNMSTDKLLKPKNVVNPWNGYKIPKLVNNNNILS